MIKNRQAHAQSNSTLTREIEGRGKRIKPFARETKTKQTSELFTHFQIAAKTEVYTVSDDHTPDALRFEFVRVRRAPRFVIVLLRVRDHG